MKAAVSMTLSEMVDVLRNAALTREGLDVDKVRVVEGDEILLEVRVEERSTAVAFVGGMRYRFGGRR